MAEQATPSVPEGITAMKSPHNRDLVVIYDSDIERADGEDAWIEGPTVDPRELP